MIIGHQKQIEFLKKVAEFNKFSHAYLFAGEDKLGKKRLAMEWISEIIGEEIINNQHPDLIFLEPEISVKTKLSKEEIRIPQIRNLIWQMSLKPYSAPFKFAVIDQAHLMNRAAQTSLLKTLEEPKGKAILILISQSPEYLLPTIVSRVQTIKFYPVSEEEIKKNLKKEDLSEKEIEEIAKISSGKPGVAMDLISDKEKVKIFHQKIRELNKISSSHLAERFQYAKELSENSQDLKENLDLWLAYFRGVLIIELNNKEKPDNKKIKKIKNILDLIQRTKQALSGTNINTRLALENLMIEI